MNDALFETRLQHACEHSQFLTRALNATPTLKHWLNLHETHALTVNDFLKCMHLFSGGQFSECEAQRLEAVDIQRFAEDEALLKKALRKTRQAVLAQLIIRDLTHAAPLEEIFRVISEFAQFAIQFALKALQHKFSALYGIARSEETGNAQSLIVIGMGKLGGFELNVSSDIDLIFLFEEHGESDGKKRLDNQEYFTRLGKKLVATLNEVTEDGFVFRVDMRLRPYGDSGPLVMSFNALENYFLAQGREWERYAWIKARNLTTPSKTLDALMRPFVYRKYLDFNAYGAMRDLYAQIQREVMRLDRFENIKLGSGGIREIEFIAQVFQLIRGGREKSLRTRSTRKALEQLAKLNLIDAQTVNSLQADYEYLRRLEHRLQYLQDQQTQTLPSDPHEQYLIAKSLGFETWETAYASICALRQRVHHAFNETFVLPEEYASPHPLAQVWQDCAHPISPERPHEDHETRLTDLGFFNAHAILQSLITLGHSSRYRQLTVDVRRRFDALIPEVLRVSATFNNPDDTFLRILNLLETILRRSAYLALLTEYPQALERVAALYSASTWIGAYINRHPILLDELLDARVLYTKPDWEKIATELDEKLNEHGKDVEAKMDTLRHVQHALQFRLIAQDLAGIWTLESLSDQLSMLADTILAASLKHAWLDIPKRHLESPQFAIISYGKLGGKELGYTADLDVVFLYDDDHPDAVQLYTRLARKLSTWLTATTAAGHLYELDFRLRPDGTAGLMVSSLESFKQYQTQKAWIWEHQALTRARFVAGHERVGAAFEQLRDDILRQPRPRHTLAQEVLSMRKKMRETHPAHDHDLKHAQGGIVDLEFIVQFLVLAHAYTFPELCGNLGNIALLKIAANASLISQEKAETAQIAYRYFRREQHRTRLQGEDKIAVDATLRTHYAHVQALWQEVFCDYE